MAIAPPPSASKDAPDGAPNGAPNGAERRAGEIARWRRRSLAIRFWRGFLPSAIGVVVLLLLGWIGVKTYQSWNQAPVTGGDIRMLHPHFFGRNDKNQPYTLTADEAVRDAHDNDLVSMVQPRLSMQTEAPAPVKAQSDHGLLNEKTHLLRMTDAVKVEDGRGYTFRSQSATIDTQTHDAYSDTHVVGDGPMGHIEADSYRIDRKNGHAVLTGHVRTHLLPHGNDAATPARKTP